MDDLKRLVGNDLLRICLYNKIYFKGKYLTIPFSIANLITTFGIGFCAKSALEIASARLSKWSPVKNLHEFALVNYGKSLSEIFLTPYSEKMWGLPCEELSSDIAKDRLNGFKLSDMFFLLFDSERYKIASVEGAFYYPKFGIGQISDAMAEWCGRENLKNNSKITRIFTEKMKIRSIEINNAEQIKVDEVISTIPISHLVKLLLPAVSDEITAIADELRYRSTILVGFVLAQGSCSKNPAIYCPEKQFIFTRVYEPKNRSIYMAPADKTMLIAEIPCELHDGTWNTSDDILYKRTREDLLKMRLVTGDTITSHVVKRIQYSYPLLNMGYKKKILKIQSFLSQFKNLHLAGRNGRFEYTWIHNLMKTAKEIVDNFAL